MSVDVIERVGHRVLLGMRFWDVAKGAPASGNLTVRGQLLTAGGARHGHLRTATRTRSGAYAFFGLHPAEGSDSRSATNAGLPAPLRIAVDVSDPAGDFLPASFDATTPASGTFDLDAGAIRPGLSGSGVPLWSSPSRALATGLTTIHAHLVLGSNVVEPPGVPWAFVQVMRQESGAWVPHASGISDERGVLALPMPYPPVPPPIATNGTPGKFLALRAQTFDLRVQVFARASLPIRPGSKVPDLRQILAQPLARVAVRRDGANLTFADDLAFHLQFGEPAVLRTATADPGKPDSYLRMVFA